MRLVTGILSAILAGLLLTSCQTVKAPEQPVKVTVIQSKIQVDKKGMPRPVQLQDPKFYVITADNFEEFKARFLRENPKFVVFALSENGYKKLLKNQAELRRYIQQQKAIIIYYESVTQAK